jgi:hypothetical protein
MLMARLARADEFTESVTSTLTLLSPGSVAVPEIIPVFELIARPAGRLPEAMDQRNGGTPPLTAIGAEYVEPAWPAGSAVVVISGGAPMVIDSEFDSPPDCEFFTATEMADALAKALAGICAVSSSALTNVVGCAAPFHTITDSAEKLVPWAVSRRAPCPTATEVGETTVSCVAAVPAEFEAALDD